MVCMSRSRANAHPSPLQLAQNESEKHSSMLTTATGTKPFLLMNSLLLMEERLTSEVNCRKRVPFIPLMLSGSFNGWGVTLFDSLDTMWIMGLHELFHESLELVAKSTFTMDQVCNLFTPESKH